MEDKKICVVCSVCGAVDEYKIDEMYAQDSFDETHILEYYVGSCSNCHAYLQWEQVYELIRVQNIQKINPFV